MRRTPGVARSTQGAVQLTDEDWESWSMTFDPVAYLAGVSRDRGGGLCIRHECMGDRRMVFMQRCLTHRKGRILELDAHGAGSNAIHAVKALPSLLILLIPRYCASVCACAPRPCPYSPVGRPSAIQLTFRRRSRQSGGRRIPALRRSRPGTPVELRMHDRLWLRPQRDAFFDAQRRFPLTHT